MDYQNLRITKLEAEDVAFQVYGIVGTAKALPGEVDFNFKISAKDGAFILKISRPEVDVGYLDFQQNLLEYIQTKLEENEVPKVVLDNNGLGVSDYIDRFGKTRKVRCLGWIEGRLWSSVNPHSYKLRFDLGAICGKLTNALQGFNHPRAHRKFEWDVAQSLWTKKHLSLFNENDLEIIQFFQKRFHNRQDGYSQLRKAVVHNDANDNNVLVSNDLQSPRVLAAIDYGDAVHTQIINDVAIAVAYAVADFVDPLQAAIPIISAYHKAFALEEEELEHLYDAIAMRMVISVTKSAINKQKEPENTYLLISEKPAWKLLKSWRNVHPDFALYHFRHACGYEPCPEAKKFATWVGKQNFQLQDLFADIHQKEVYPLDLSVGSLWLGNQEELDDLDCFGFKLTQLQK
ncbi:MAG: phosphotransferase, partial [Flavobacteriaceae bacterium]|nr:phosphotransferase [Flavobacteriaceae bacterium]